MPFESYLPEQLLGRLNAVEQKNAPARLYAAGDVGILSRGARVSIVGSRKASPEGLDQARQLSERLASRGVVIVSGLAEGIDTAAHRTSIAVGGKTIAVLGTSLDRYYPASNRELQQLLMREHLVLSQFAIGSPSQPSHFPMRNRTMALVSDATIIVEAGESSGTLHQGWEALRLGRLLLLLETLVAQPGLSWPAEMMRYGAQALDAGNWEAILEHVPPRTGDQPSSLAH